MDGFNQGDDRELFFQFCREHSFTHFANVSVPPDEDIVPKPYISTGVYQADAYFVDQGNVFHAKVDNNEPSYKWVNRDCVVVDELPDTAKAVPPLFQVVKLEEWVVKTFYDISADDEEEAEEEYLNGTYQGFKAITGEVTETSSVRLKN